MKRREGLPPATFDGVRPHGLPLVAREIRFDTSVGDTAEKVKTALDEDRISCLGGKFRRAP